MRIHEKKPTCPFVTHSNTNIIELMRHLWTLSIQTSIDSKLRNSLSSNHDNGEDQRNDTLFIFFWLCISATDNTAVSFQVKIKTYV